MQPLISVIVPVYNIEKYIGRCIESIVNQTYKNLEILLVDDGSEDNSGKICDDYAKRDARTKVIHKQNAGVSDARNAAIDVAQGELLAFVDGDDLLTPNCVESLWRAKELTGAQIACCLVRRFRGDVPPDYPVEFYSDEKVSLYPKVTALEKMLRKSDFNVSAGGKLYEKALFENIHYPNGVWFEDVATTYKLFVKTNAVAFVRTAGYIYRVRPGSQQHQKFTKQMVNELRFAKEQKQYLDGKFPELKSATADCLVSSCFHMLFGIYGNKDGKTEFAAECKEAERIIREHRAELIKDKRTSKKTRFGCLLSYLGFNFTYGVYKLLGVRGRPIG